MRPSLRLLKVLATSPLKGRADPLDETVTHWRVMPNDLDLFGHMNNSRYLQLMDCARTDYLIRVGLMPAVLKNKWTIPIGATRITFHRTLKPFQDYEIVTQVLSYDERYFYISHTFRTREDPA